MRESKVLRVIICIIAIVFVAHQVYSSAYKPITTVSAQYYTAEEGFLINGIVIREEKIITTNTKGTLHFTLFDGERVAKTPILLSPPSLGGRTVGDHLSLILRLNSHKIQICE